MKIELDAALEARVRAHALAAELQFPEEFVQHAIEKELAKTEPGDDVRRTRGIGYLDAGRDI